MPFKRRFRRPFRRTRRRPADVQTLSLCDFTFQVGPLDVPADCQHPVVQVTPIVTGVSPEQSLTQMFATNSAARGVSFLGAKYDYYARSSKLLGPSQFSIGVVSTVYMCWVKMTVDRKAPFAPLFLPNIIIGDTTNATNTPIGDPTIDIFHRRVFDVFTPRQTSCEPVCESLGNVNTISAADDTQALWDQNHATQWFKDSVRSRRFLKDNETIFLYTSVVSGLPHDGSNFFLDIGVYGHLALKARF